MTIHACVVGGVLQAVQCITECLSLRREVMVPSSPRVAVAEALAAQVLTHAGRYVDALALCETNVRPRHGRHTG